MLISRRTFLLALSATALANSWEAKSQPAVTRTRYNAASPEGKAMLRIYAEGVKRMKALGTTDPTSWNFQWYIHATPRSKDQLIASTFGNSASPGRELARDTWYTCQSHQGQPEDYFLPWHRLYLLHFEEIVRAITGRQDFTLPYWDYTSPASYTIPDEFQAKNKDDVLFSSLFVANRNKDDVQQRTANINAGEPLNKYFRGPRNFLVLPDMSQSSYSLFCNGLDSSLHGNVHVYTGDASNMGSVPTSAGDPVFWLHHCNIDRIWAAWNASGGKNPTQTNGVKWTDTKFVFADGKGKRSQVALSTVSDSAALPYRYDTLPGQIVNPILTAGSPSDDRVLLKSVAAGTTPMSGPVAAAVPLGSAAQTVRLAPTKPQNRLMSLAPGIGGDSRFVLVLKEVQARTNPNTTYEIFLDLPPDSSPDVADDHYVGLLNFFGAVLDPGHGAHGGRTVEFDVTGIVQRLMTSNKLQSDTSVTLAPVGAPAENSAPVIAGGIELQRL